MAKRTKAQLIEELQRVEAARQVAETALAAANKRLDKAAQCFREQRKQLEICLVKLDEIGKVIAY